MEPPILSPDNLVNGFLIGIAHQITILDSAVMEKHLHCQEKYAWEYSVMPQKLLTG